MLEPIAVYGLTLLIIIQNTIQFAFKQKYFSRAEKLRYFLLLLSFGLWTCINAISDLVKNYDIALLAAKLSVLVIPVLGFSIIMSITSFPFSRRHNQLKKSFLYFFLLLMFLIEILCIIFFDSHLLHEFKIYLNRTSEFKIGIIYNSALLFLIFCTAIGIIYWILNYGKLIWSEKQQIKILGLVLTLCVCFYIIFPIFDLIQLGAIVFILISIFLTQLQSYILLRSTIKYNYFNIRDFYLGLSIVCLIIFSLLVGFFMNANGLSILTISILVIVPLTIIAMRLIKIFNETDSLFEQVTLNFIENSNNLTEKEQIYELMVTTVRSIIPTASVEIFNRKTIDPEVLPLLDNADEFDDKINYIFTKEMLLLDYFERNKNLASLNFYNYFISKNLDCILILRSESLLNYVCISNSRNYYDQKTVKYLTLLAKNASIVLGRSELFNRIAKFTKELENTVEEKTIELRSKNQNLEIALNEVQFLDNKRKELIQIASHEIRTPIFLLREYVSMLQKKDLGNVTPEQQTILSKSEKNVKQLVNIVEDILNTSRIEEGMLVIKKTRVDMVQIISSVMDQLAQKALNKKLEFTSEIKLKKAIVSADKDKIFEVIMNVIDNALNYTSKGSVTVKLSDDNNSLLLTVRDTGIGIPKDSQDKIFNRFSRLENAMKLRKEGTGIGLYITKTIVDAHNGRIWFESTEGKGTSFFIKLPYKKKAHKKRLV